MLPSLALVANDYYFDRGQEEELSETLGQIEMDCFDSEGIALFGMELDDGEEFLFPWGENFFVDEKKVLLEVRETVQETKTVETAFSPTVEEVPQRSNRLLTGRPRVVPYEHKKIEKRAVQSKKMIPIRQIAPKNTVTQSHQMEPSKKVIQTSKIAPSRKIARGRKRTKS